jgi:hypothetical protein
MTSARIAPPVVILVAAVVITGVAAAQRVAPVLWLVTPVVAAVILRAAARDGAALQASGVVAPELPASLRDRLDSVLAQLGDGDARRLLLGVVAQGRLLLARHESRFDSREEQRVRDDVSALIEACCATAGDLGRVEQFTSATGSAPATANAALMEKAEKARELFRGRLTSAAEALATLYASGLEQGTPSTDRIAELTSQITTDATARAAATTELRDLLS